MSTKTIDMQTVKQSKLKIFIPFGVSFRRVDKDITEFLYQPIRVPAISTKQGEYIFAYKNHIWCVQKHLVKEVTHEKANN